MVSAISTSRYQAILNGKTPEATLVSRIQALVFTLLAYLAYHLFPNLMSDWASAYTLLINPPLASPPAQLPLPLAMPAPNAAALASPPSQAQPAALPSASPAPAAAKPASSMLPAAGSAAATPSPANPSPSHEPGAASDPKAGANTQTSESTGWWGWATKTIAAWMPSSEDVSTAPRRRSRPDFIAPYF